MTEQSHNENQKSCSHVRLVHKVFEPDTGADPTLNPIIFLHGLTSCKETWACIPQILADATKRKAYSYDARNHGDSDWSNDFTMDDLDSDLRNLMESNDISKAILIGHSLGGTSSINFALKTPEKVEMMVIEEMFVRSPPTALCAIPLAYATLAPMAVTMVPDNVDEEAASKMIMEFIFENISSKCVTPPTLSKFDKSTMALKRTEDGRFALKANMPVIEKSLRLVIDGKLIEREEQSTYDGPACFVFGELSPFQVGKDADNIRKYFPKAEFAEIKNAKHTVHSDNAESFIDTILKFISRNSPAKDKLLQMG